MKSKKDILSFLDNKYFWIFVAIFLVGVFLRSFQFPAWLHFELDQSRDAFVIDQVTTGGVGELPLLGPRAAGSMLRLGPAFYYLEYLGSILAGNVVIGSAYVILFFSILSIPLAYFFFRRYFGVRSSFLLLSIFSTSLFLVTYSRFAWNPNIVPFFVLGCLYSALRAVDAKNKAQGWWLVALAFVFSILIQLHFVALLVISGALGLFFAVKRPRIALKFWIASAVVFLTMNAPMVINEIKTGGDNAKLFVAAVTQKSDETNRTLIEKIIRNYSEQSLAQIIILSGNQSGELPSVFFGTSKHDIKCDKICRKNIWIGLAGFLIVTAGVALLFLRAWKEFDVSKKDFLVLSSILFVVSFVIFTPLSFDLSPRFFLIVIPLPFVFLGLILESLEFKFGAKEIFPLVVAVLVILNIIYVSKFFNELKLSKSENIEIGTDRILKQKVRITLEQQNEIVDYMQKAYSANGHPIVFRGQSEFHRAFTYLLGKKNIPWEGILMQTVYKNANYFLIVRTQADMNPFYAKYGEKFDFSSKKRFGTLTVFGLTPKNEAITDLGVSSKEKDVDKEDVSPDDDQEARRYKWKEIW